MNSEFILLLRSEFGINRISVQADITLKAFHDKVSQVLNVPVEQLDVYVNNNISTSKQPNQ